MYRYNDFDRAALDARNAQFRAQVARRLDGSLSEEEFRPLRLMNGVYLQLHAYMLRIAIPYGTLNSAQMRRLADVADRWDRGYGHFTTRQNIQFNWPRLVDIPDILDALGEVGIHAIQTSGNCVRNVTADHFAGAAADEIADPRPYAELLRQYSTDHPEFQFLPRKFKIAITGASHDRAVTRAHDIGLRMVRRNGIDGFEVLIGGGLGRTPMVGKMVRDFLPAPDLLPYVEAILGEFNALGRRDNKYKARLKIVVHELGLDYLRDRIEARFDRLRGAWQGADQAILADIRAQFGPPDFARGDERADLAAFEAARAADPGFRSFTDTNLTDHRRADHAIVSVSLKAHGDTPGDCSADQMRVLADLAARYGYDELRISHEQNVVLPHIRRADLPAVYKALRAAGLATANIGLASDIIACPGMDYCTLATARSIPVAQAIATQLRDEGIEADIGPLKIKISGCINACGHHHVGHIGILGLDRAGVENYQVTLGGSAAEDLRMGKRAGPGFSYDALVPALVRMLRHYLEIRKSGETFAQTVTRLGVAPFKQALYDSEVPHVAA